MQPKARNHPDSITESLGISPSAWRRFVPDDYASYRPAIQDALSYFIAHLPPRRRDTLTAHLRALPRLVPAEIRLLTVLKACPCLHKLGQVLARDQRLAPSLRRQLVALECLPPSQDVHDLRITIEAELSSVRHAGVTLDDVPLAEGSVATVLPFTWEAGPSNAQRRGVFKVLKPDIQQRVHEDIEVLSLVGAFLDERTSQYGLPAVRYRDTIESVRQALLSEVRLEVEQSNARQARVQWSEGSEIWVPEILSWSTPRLTAMEFIPGVSVVDATLSSPQRHRMAGLVVRSLLAAPLWSAESEPLFHADPHGGNLVATPDGRLGLLDWSLTGRLRKHLRVALTQVMVAGVLRDSQSIASALSRCADKVYDERLLRDLAHQAVATTPHGVLPDFGWMCALLDAVALSGTVRFPGDLLLFRKTAHVVSGIVHSLCEAFPVNEAINAAFLRVLSSEWQARFVAWPDWRGFASHCATSDLWRLVVGLQTSFIEQAGVWWRRYGTGR